MVHEGNSGWDTPVGYAVLPRDLLQSDLCSIFLLSSTLAARTVTFLDSDEPFHRAEFHEMLHSLLLWLAQAEKKLYAVNVSDLLTPSSALLEHRDTLTVSRQLIPSP
ncbi:nesprin-1-like protein [Lates japonicus]|uniref:Nesprin-1-like protein n=1 Tax=Lates japonicus TaxID=270547 RepID=A0AAD3MNG6_LATJO|nr:nesprin-1-like protein [Lates japonicus]